MLLLLLLFTALLFGEFLSFLASFPLFPVTERLMGGGKVRSPGPAVRTGEPAWLVNRGNSQE